MIRDEFKNADKKTINKKANKKLISLGERAYYTKMVQRYSGISKPIGFSTIFTLISFGIISIIYLLPAFLAAKDYVVPVVGWVIVGVECLVLVWTLVWYIYLKGHIAKKLVFYRQELERLNREYVIKHNKAR